MEKIISNLLLIVLTGLAFVWSYNNLVKHLNKHFESEAQSYIAQNEAIRDLQSKYPDALTKKDILEYDRKKGTNLSQILERAEMKYMGYAEHKAYYPPVAGPFEEQRNINKQLDFLRLENDLKALEISNKEKRFWSYLPEFPVLFFGALGTFLAALITNLGNTCFEKMPALLSRVWSYIKKNTRVEP